MINYSIFLTIIVLSLLLFFNFLYCTIKNCFKKGVYLFTLKSLKALLDLSFYLCEAINDLDLPLSSVLGDEHWEIPAVAVLHDDVYRGVAAVDDSVVVAHDVLVLQLAQEVDLWHQHLFLRLCHGAILHLLPHKYLYNQGKCI